MAFCREQNQKLLFKVDSVIDYKYSLMILLIFVISLHNRNISTNFAF